MDIQNSTPPTKNKKTLLLPVLIFGLIGTILLGILGFSIFNKNKSADDPQFIDDQEKEQIERQSIPGASQFEKDGISFSHPADYKINELEKNYYVVFKEGKSIPGEAGINIDARRQGDNSNYNQAIQAGRDSLLDPKEKEIPGGVKMYGTIKEGIGKGIPTLYVFLKFGDGVIKVEHSGEILNEAVFDQVVNSIKFN